MWAGAINTGKVHLWFLWYREHKEMILASLFQATFLPHLPPRLWEHQILQVLREQQGNSYELPQSLFFLVTSPFS